MTMPIIISADYMTKYVSHFNMEVMRIPLDRRSETPLYRQISEYISRQIKAGGYPPFTRLPSARTLARENSISRSTVEKVFEELEAQNLVQIRPGSGVFTLNNWKKISINEPLIDHTDNTQNFRPFDPVNKDGVIDFSYGGGDPRLFPLKDFKICLQKTIDQAGLDFFAYGDIRGYAPLRQSVASILSTQGMMTNSDNIILTNGSQQALSLLCRRFLKPGSRIACEEFCYGEALNLFRAEAYEILPVPMDEEGMQTDKLKEILEKKNIDMLYTIPNFQNPTGISSSQSRRLEIITLMDQYGFVIIEDDYIGDLNYDAACPPSIKALAGDRPVFYTGTFSKMLIPGLRFGFLISNTEKYQTLVDYKRFSDLTSPLLTQQAIDRFINLGRYQNHIEQSRKLYRKRRNHMVNCLKKRCSEHFNFSVPGGGLFIWLQFKKPIDDESLFQTLKDAGVKLAPGWMFQTVQSFYSQGVRLNFAHLTEHEIELGIEKLAEVLSSLTTVQSL